MYIQKGELKKHVEECPKCIETAPGHWDLCEEGQRILRENQAAKDEL